MTTQRIASLTADDRAHMREYSKYVRARGAALDPRVGELVASEHAHAAILEDQWDPLEAHLRALGAKYAEAGRSYSSWFELVTSFRESVRAELAEPPLVQGLTKFLDIVVEGIAEGFFAWKSDRLKATEEQLHRAQKLDAVGRLAGSVAHDFNNVLTVVESYAWMLEDSFEPTDPRKADVIEIRRAAERAAGITRQLLAISRHSMALPQSLQLDDVIAAFAPMLRKLLGAQVELVIQRGAPPTVVIDPGQLEQVLMNLVINARDAMDGRGRVTIETSQVEVEAEDAEHHGGRSGRFAVVAIADTGTGMDAETRLRIFDPFFTTKDVGKGTGLGLAIVHGIVEQAGGTIEVYSEVTRGTTFRVKLPFATTDAPPRRDLVERPTRPLPPVTVLIVDDQDEVRVVACRILQQAGCTILQAHSAAEARKICVSHDGPIHVALLDIALTDGRGDLVGQELRQLRADLEILLMSGYPVGAVGPAGDVPTNLIAKPFTPSQLRSAIAEVVTVGPTPRRSEPTLQPRVLLADDDNSLRRMLLRFLKKHGYEVTEAGTGNEAIAALQTSRFDVVLSDVHMPDGDGLDILRAVRRVDLDVPVILISGMPDVETASKALEYGAFRYLTKPLDLEAVDKLVRHATRAHALARLRREAMTITGAPTGASDRAGLEVRFEKAIEHMYMAFQPIVDAKTGALYGVEALVRTHEPSIPTPGALLDAAVALDRLPQLGRRVRALSGAALAARPDIQTLFVNLHPEDVLDIDLIDLAAPLTQISSRVILEITERASLTPSPVITERLERIRKLGFRIAVDDIGAGYSGLQSFADLMPEVVKIDMSLVRDIHANPLKQRTVAALCNLCHEVGALVVGEGVETEAERERLVALGCDLLQGFLIARPSPQLPPA